MIVAGTDIFNSMYKLKKSVLLFLIIVKIIIGNNIFKKNWEVILHFFIIIEHVNICINSSVASIGILQPVLVKFSECRH